MDIFCAMKVLGKTRFSALINEAIHRGKFLLDMVQRHECLHVVVMKKFNSLSSDKINLS